MALRILTASGLALLAGLALCSCNSRPEYEELFTPVYREFSADVLKADPGYELVESRKDGSWNPRTQRGRQTEWGIIAAPQGEIDPEAMLASVKRYIEKWQVRGPHVEGDQPGTYREEMPSYRTLFQYNLDRMHGEIAVWLFPYPDGTRAGFAVYRVEHRLDRPSLY